VIFLLGVTGAYHHAQLLGEMGSHELVSPGLALNHDPPDLSLPSSQDYRCEPPVPG
jgi:hypothetical protein